MALVMVASSCRLLGPVYGAATDSEGIFPTDDFTVPDSTQVTGRRVNIEPPTCAVAASDCADVALLNELDGFDLDPRIGIRVAGTPDLTTVTTADLYVQATAGGPRIALNRLIMDAPRRTVFGHPETVLEPATEYRIHASAAFAGRARETTFTTMSVGHELLSMRAQLDSGSAYSDAGIPANQRGLNFIGSNNERTVFPAEGVANMFRYNDLGSGQEGIEPVFDADVTFTPDLPSVLDPSNVTNVAGVGGLYAFGSFQAPSWMNADRFIPRTPSLNGAPDVFGSETVGFALIVPPGTPPAGGWPVAIFGPGVTRSKYDVFLAADMNAENGMATIAIDPYGHAFGPDSDLAVIVADASLPPSFGIERFSGFGRGVDANGDGTITNREGLQVDGHPAPEAAILLRDGLRQTVADQMSLVRAIAAGSDVDGDGSDDLSSTEFRYYGQSLGGIYGTMFAAVENRIDSAAFTVPGGTVPEIARLAPAFRPVVAEELGNRDPDLLNGGVDGFTEDVPLFLDPPVTNLTDGAAEIQDVLGRFNWLSRSGSPDAYAPMLRKRPFPGQTPKKVLYQFAFGDQTVTNPTSATLMRAGEFQDVTTVYRNDLTPTAGQDPHGVLLDPRISGRQQAQQQFTEFLASDGTVISDPDGPLPVFEVPVNDPDILEVLNF